MIEDNKNDNKLKSVPEFPIRPAFFILDELGLTTRQKTLLQNTELQAKAVAQVDLLYQWQVCEHHHVLILDQPEYPSLLSEIHSPPFVLMVKGKLEALHQPSMSMVGSRNPSAEGLHNARLFSRYLSQKGFAVISGGAAGIDKACHDEVLKMSGSTIAVLGHGFHHCYPKHHQKLYESIQQEGALVSEFPLDVGPRPQFFPRRNRIITGLSLGVCVVEAGLASGSLVSARWALEQNREVFAIPGSIHNPRAQGCHQLIQQGAKLVQSGDDILKELQISCFDVMTDLEKVVCDTRTIETSGATQTPLDLEALKSLNLREGILKLLSYEKLSADSIAAFMSHLDASLIIEELTLLEIEQLIFRDTGYFYNITPAV